MNERYIIDRIENDIVILEKENGDMTKIYVKNIVGSFKEGDILVKDGQCFKVDEEFTKIRKDEIDHIMKDMWE